MVIYIYWLFKFISGGVTILVIILLGYRTAKWITESGKISEKCTEQNNNLGMVFVVDHDYLCI